MKQLRLLQINVCSAVFSTGRIAEDIAKVAQAQGWATFIAYGRMSRPSVSEELKIGGPANEYIHYLQHRLLDREGLGSVCATKKLLAQMEEIKPDIVHLHNLHDHYLNYPLLLDYLQKKGTPVVWTLHDCWPFTGGCNYFNPPDCEKWKKGCGDCADKRAFFADRSREQFLTKASLLGKIDNLTLVPVSDWLAGFLKDSFLSGKRCRTIHNGIDTEVFRPLGEKNVQPGKFRILGVASQWSRRKGLDDFIKLRSALPEDFEIRLVGLDKKTIGTLPKGIKGMSQTTDLAELVRLYNKADVYVNPTYADNFPTTNLEALSCGTPVITYRTGGSPEAVDEKTGIVVEQGNFNALADAIRNLKEKNLSPSNCRQRAVSLFDKRKCFDSYINLYNSII
ncbi:MAG: glycosyltransferase [Bacteroidales bacterium]|nr:glycosyltransferase [Bacteroidales bacterium]